MTKVVMGPFSILDKAIKEAVSFLENDYHNKKHNMFPKQTAAERNRMYLKDGYKPEDPAHAICLYCEHSYVDEPNTNKTTIAIYKSKKMEYEKASKENKEAKATGGKKELPKLPPNPKRPTLVRQCHCHQMACVNIGSDLSLIHI